MSWLKVPSGSSPLHPPGEAGVGANESLSLTQTGKEGLKGAGGCICQDSSCV